MGSPNNRRKADDSCQALSASVGACQKLLRGRQLVWTRCAAELVCSAAVEDLRTEPLTEVW